MACLIGDCSNHFTNMSNDCSDIAVCPVCGKFTRIRHDEFGEISNPYINTTNKLYKKLLKKAKLYNSLNSG